MGLHIIATTSLIGILEWAWVIFQVGFGLGMVIFVHELGHFLVAKACGVQCDKFYIGFDIGGWKIWHKQWGETEYGIGILPLGGYVKMLGQDDNPAKAAEEMRRARMYLDEQQANPSPEDESQPSTSSTSASDATAAQPGDQPSGASEPADSSEPDGAEPYVLNPRSYLAKSVPQRMAIISAGVIMNIIFAFIFAVAAYMMGVPYLPSVVMGTAPGSPAWVAGLEPGERVISIEGLKDPRFRDLKTSVSLGNMQDGVPLEVENPQTGKTRKLTLIPRDTEDQPLPTIGIMLPSSLVLMPERPFYPHTPAAAAKENGGFQGGDQIVEIDGQPVNSGPELNSVLAEKRDKRLMVTVRRGGKPKPGSLTDELEGGELKKIAVDPRPMKRLGLVMQMGKITAIQQGSPAADAGLQQGDFIEKLNDEAIGDPLTLPERLRREALAGNEVVLTVRRTTTSGGEELIVTLKPRVANWYESSRSAAAPMSAPSLGIAYHVLNVVASIDPGSPAAKAGDKLRPHDEIISAKFVFGEDDPKPEQNDPIEFGDEKPNWPSFMFTLQSATPDTKILLTVKRGDKTEEVTLAPQASEGSYYPPRGWVREPLRYIRKAETFGQALTYARQETADDLLMVYRFLKKLGTQVPLTALGGPITIARVAGYSAFDSPSALLIFLTMLSANLAVINFLPIPVLDGGHMVFLIYEGIFRRPVSEKVAVICQAVGLAFILGLMLFVIGLDIGRLTNMFS